MALDNGGNGGVHSPDHTAALPPELWAELLRRVPDIDRMRHVPLVSRRFTEACRYPSLWPELRVLVSQIWPEARWRSFLRWLALRASEMKLFAFVYEMGGLEDAAPWDWRIPELIALLAASAPQLQSLEYRYPSSAAAIPASALPADLERLSQLTSLTLGFGTARVTTAQVDAMAQGLPSLQHLSLGGSVRLPDGRPIQALAEGFPVSIATCCSQLRRLCINIPQFRAVPPELGRLTALTRLQLSSYGTASLPDSISRLSALREVEVPVDSSLPSGLAACQQLTKLEMGVDEASPVLAKLRSLRSLRVVSLLDLQPHATYWTQLTSLTELLLGCPAGGSISAGLGGMTGLRQLRILDASLDDLPAGPYLSRLDDLHVVTCTFRAGVPARLADATQLRRLFLQGNRGMGLSAAEVAALSSLPALIDLGLRAPPGANQAEWDAGVAQLRATFAAQGRAVDVLSR